jgi:asparagine synthase (glutamine-hydrolysing)
MKSLVQNLRESVVAFRLSRLARDVKRQNLTYLSNEKLLRLQRTLGSVEASGTEGDFIEFGVALGGSAILIAMAAKNKSRFLGFDVFGLIPEPTSAKDDEMSRRRFEEIVAGASAGIGGETYYGYRKDLFGDVVRAFLRNGLRVDGDKVALVKGLFEDTWIEQEVEKVAFCHIDCDWYDPVKFCLGAVAPILAAQGVIVLDDYHDYGGCRTAVEEFLHANAEFELVDGPNVILRRRKIH